MVTEEIGNKVHNNKVHNKVRSNKDSKAGCNDKATIKIPRPLYNKIATVIADGSYNSVTDFVVYVLRDLVTSHELAQNAHSDTPDNDTDVIKRRLRKLGYM